MSTPPLLAARDLRIDVAGSVAIEHATFDCAGRSVVLLGDGFALIAALLGHGQIRTGTLKLHGWNVERREHWRAPGRVGFAPLDPPLLTEWTALEYVVASGRLAGLGRREAQRAAIRTMDELDLGALEKRPIRSCSLAERRAIVLAQALVTSPAILVAPGPLTGLSRGDADFVLGVLDRARTARTWVSTISGARLAAPEHTLASWADDVLVFSSGQVVRQGSLSALEQGAAGYTIMVRGKVEAFRQALAEQNLHMRGGPERFSIELGPTMSLSQILAISLQVGAPIIELVPRLLTEPIPV